MLLFIGDKMSIIKNKLLEIRNLKEIHQGGQKKVFIGEKDNIGEVIIKVGSYNSENTLERIKREINFLNSTNSKYYPRNLDFIIDTDTKQFLIIEEYIKSINFFDIKSSFNNEKEIISCFIELLKGLSIIWDQRIYHRDIKPDNILFKSKNEVVIIDLGIARFLDLDSLTNTMALRGPCTPVFAAPEQLLNKKNIIDQRTDFFALGILLTIMLYDIHPFDPNHTNPKKNIVENIISEDPINLCEKFGASIEFNKLIQKLLSKQQYNRFRNYNQIFTYINQNWR